MYCGKCGSEVNNGVLFCPNCGEQLTNEYVIKNSEIKKPVKKISGKIFKIIIPIVVLIIFAVTATVLIKNNNSYKKVIENFYKAVETQDIKLMKSTLAQYWIDYQKADYDKEEYLDSDIESIIADVIDSADCGENIEILSCTITNEKKADKEDLKALKDNIYDWYAYYIYSEDDFNSSISDACVVTVRIKVKGDEDVNMLTSKILTIKENGKWRITVSYLDNSFYEN